MDPEFLAHPDFVSSGQDYLKRIRELLKKAKLIRFVIGFVSEPGLKAIGKPLLAKALLDDDSFGVASLALAEGYKPLLKLNDSKPEMKTKPKLKYFMNPLACDKDPQLTLLHSKLVYLTDKEREAWILIGSHNWTGPALGGTSSRNAETSLGFSVRYNEVDLLGTSDNLASQVNGYLKKCWELQSCLAATCENESAFEQWMGTAKGQPASEDEMKLDEVLVLKAFCEPAADQGSWQDLQDKTAYIQLIEEGPDPKRLWEAGTEADVRVHVWKSLDDFKCAQQFVLLRGRLESKHHNNKKNEPLKAPIHAVMRPDSKQVNNSGIEAELFRFSKEEAPIEHIDGGKPPLYQFLVRLDEVKQPSNAPSKSTAGDPGNG